MEIKLRYSSDSVSLEVPEQNIAQYIKPDSESKSTDNFSVISNAIESANPEDFKTAILDKKLCIITTDGSRDFPLGDILPQLLKSLSNCKSVSYVIATGTHNSETKQNERIVETIEKYVSKPYIHIHDCMADSFVTAGKTSRGTAVEYNSVINDAEMFLVLSDVKFHYFAGYSNPVKNFVPGICSYKTAEGNHSLALDEQSAFGLHPLQNDPARRDNPLACDQLEAMRMIVGDRKVWAFTTVSTHGNIGWAKFDKIDSAAACAFDIADQRNAKTVEPVDYLIVSPGGLPNDVDLYISQRALELTKSGVNDGGEILFLSACPEGVGSERTKENFYNILIRPLDEILAAKGDDYKLFSHKPYKFAQLISRLKHLWIFTNIPEAECKKMHLDPTDDPQEVVNDWIGKNPTAQILIVDGANKIALKTAAGGEDAV
ncbi:MAG: DUF2088 domain-containing protein [Planctomycetes bacterium]|nr:DUF2088 domain-containing protein [Planctomycetota bacterium]